VTRRPPSRHAASVSLRSRRSARRDQRDPAARFTLPAAGDDREHRRQANRAVGVSAIGLALTGMVELGIALVSGSVALLGDALHN
jgi:Co/Zn/Cd efflux system component